ncbi:glutathione S-transferase family protein [Hyphococcus sp.]|uniref:glutathione S-transferase family protein n=1 Tax=Hyphococcus sp. TaxID=2038636 RepID=UPI003CCC324B
MSDLILHHFDASPFAEKIRKIFGVKGLSWRSVQIPMVTPKPDLTALTGGYRKTPVLQIGADIYCDTQLIARIIDHLHPEPPLFKSGPLAAFGLQQWCDAAFFAPGAALSLFENAEHIPADVAKDREDYFTFLNFNTFAQDAPHFRSQFRAHFRLIEQQLSDGRGFLFGSNPEWADIGGYFNFWMAENNIPSSAQYFKDMHHAGTWYARMKDFGAGVREEISPGAALEIANTHSPNDQALGAPIKDESGAKIGDAVTVTPSDHGKVPVAGVLSHINDHEIVIRRNDDRAGAVAVHFPRLGFRVEKAG